MDEGLAGRVTCVYSYRVARVGGVGAGELEPNGTTRASDQDSFAVTQVVKPLEEVNSS